MTEIQVYVVERKMSPSSEQHEAFAVFVAYEDAAAIRDKCGGVGYKVTTVPIHGPIDQAICDHDWRWVGDTLGLSQYSCHSCDATCPS